MLLRKSHNGRKRGATRTAATGRIPIATLFARAVLSQGYKDQVFSSRQLGLKPPLYPDEELSNQGSRQDPGCAILGRHVIGRAIG